MWILLLGDGTMSFVLQMFFDGTDGSEMGRKFGAPFSSSQIS
jgi:hypothetical protein